MTSPLAPPRVAAVIVAGGRGTRFGVAASPNTPLGAQLPKQFQAIGERPVVGWAAEALLALPVIDAVQLVLPEFGPRALAAWLALLPPEWRQRKLLPFAEGGAERAESVRRGLAALPSTVEIVAIHDGARPFPPAEATAKAIETVTGAGPGTACLLAMPVTDTVKEARNAVGSTAVGRTLDRRALWLAQTPQVAWRADLEAALAAWPPNLPPPTDESEALERAGCRVILIEGDERNRKITRRPDLEWARWRAERDGLV